jgi:hypothetical protein
MALESENRQLIGHANGRSAVIAPAGDRSVESRILALEQRLAALEAVTFGRPANRSNVSEIR